MTEEKKIPTIEPPKAFEPAIALGPEANHRLSKELTAIVNRIMADEGMDKKHAVYALMGVVCFTFPDESLAFVDEDFTATEHED